MTDLRFRQRHAHQTLINYVKTGMQDLGWGDASLASNDPLNAAIPFGTVAITWVEEVPDENAKDVAQNTVAITMGDEGTDDLGQLGGGYYWLRLPLFLDVFGVDQSVAVSIGSDLKGLVNYQRHIPLLDFTSDSAGTDTGDLIEFEMTIGPERPPASNAATDFRRFWRVVKTMAVVQYEGGD